MHKRILKFNAADYVNITSFKHQPYYKPFILQVPDNFSNGAFYNLPLSEMINLVKSSLQKGYTVLWDADVSNNGFRQEWGYALSLKNGRTYTKEEFVPDTGEQPYDEDIRQELYENLTTQDDHLMHIVGYEKSKEGKDFFIVKNSWGTIGPFKGFIKVSAAYFAINTISLVVPKAAFAGNQLTQMEIR
jgi:bleomycin hydrolase